MRGLRTAAAVAAAALALTASPAHGIVNGRYVGAGNYLYVAELSNQAGSFCTGTLVHASWVLTAAHCSVPNSVGDLRVRLANAGTSGSGGQFRKVAQVIRHPDYRGGHNDVALWRLETPVTTFPALRLGTAGEASRWDGVGGDTGNAVGWGQTSPTSGMSTQLMHRSVTIGATVPDGANIPALEVSGGPCYGDSGSPLISFVNGTPVVAGVLKAANCASSGSYSRVSEGTNRTFIDANLRPLQWTFYGAGDWDRDGHADILVREDATGDLYLYPGQSVRGYSTFPRVKIGNGWLGWTFAGMADWDRDGHQDILTRDDRTGDLWLYPGRSVRGYPGIPPVRLIDSSFREVTPIGAADWDKDGKPDIVFREDVSGAIRMMVGTGVRGVAPVTFRTIANMTPARSPFGVADWDKDGKQDLMTRDNDTGNLHVHRGDGPLLGLYAPVQIGNGWHGATPFGLLDWDRDSHADIVTRIDASRDLMLYPGRSVMGYPGIPPVRIGNGW